jgi:hypothetical protein
MSFFKRVEPELRALIAYIVARAREQSVTLNRTKLVKLLYLVDVERVRSQREPLTGLEWVFFHYGPYAFELIDTLKQMEDAELSAQPWRDSVMYRGAPGAPDGEDWVPHIRSTVDDVIRRFAPLDLHELLDYVYFRTGPMVNAQRGQHLDLRLARDDPPQRAPVPLRPAPQPEDLAQRLAQWRARTARRLPPIELDPPGAFLDDPGEDLAGEGVRGRLHVPDDQEL